MTTLWKGLCPCYTHTQKKTDQKVESVIPLRLKIIVCNYPAPKISL